MQKDTTKTRTIIAELMQNTPTATADIGALIIEIHVNGNSDISRNTLEVLQSLGGEADVIAEIEGDLFMLDNKKEQARSAYEKANSIRPTDMRVMKARLVTS